MLKKIKSGLKKVVLSAMIAGTLGTAGYGCGPIAQDGVKIKAEGDGVITEEDVKSLSDIMAQKTYNLLMKKDDELNAKGIDIYAWESKGVTEFQGPIQNFVNDLDIMFIEEFRKLGLERPRFDDKLHISLEKGRTEMEKEYKAHNIIDMPDYAAAFYAPANSTIYIQQGEEFENFYNLFHHEVGHDMRYGNWEYGSVASETYATLKLYNLNKALGSAVLSYLRNNMPRLKGIDFSRGFFDYYNLSVIGFYAIANLHDGSLEQGWDYIMNAPQLHIDKKVEEIISSYKDLREASISEFEKLLASEGFRQSFGRLSDEEFREFADYLKLRINFESAYADFFEKHINPEGGGLTDVDFDARRRVQELGESFLANHGSNRYFTAMAKQMMMHHYDCDKRIMAAKIGTNAWTLDNIKDEYNYVRKIIDLGREYPCKFDLKECPMVMTYADVPHVWAYVTSIYDGFSLIYADYNPQQFVDLAVEFVNKFYPEKKFSILENDMPLDTAGPRMLYNSAVLFKVLAERSNVPAEYIKYCDMAKQWFSYTKEASCETVPEEAKERCINEFGDYGAAADSQIKELGDCSFFK